MKLCVGKRVPLSLENSERNITYAQSFSLSNWVFCRSFDTYRWLPQRKLVNERFHQVVQFLVAYLRWQYLVKNLVLCFFYNIHHCTTCSRSESARPCVEQACS